MNTLDLLLKEHCPNGVEFRPLGDVSKVTIGEFIRKDKQNPSGKYPVYNGGTTPTGYYDEYNQTENKIIISARGSAGYVNRVFTKFWSGNSCYTISTDAKVLDWTFAYHYLKNNEHLLLGAQQRGGIPAVSKAQVETFLIPIPPLPVQEEIVRILDTFTELIAELTAELTARKKQYEYYRDELLTLGPEVPMEALGDVCLATENIKWDSETDTYWYIDLASVCRDSHSVIEVTEVNRDTAPSRAQKLVKEDDVIFATTRPTLQRYSLIDSVLDGHICSTGFSVLRADKTKVLPKWIYYNIAKTDFYTYIESVQRGSAYPAVSDRDVKAYKIPIPSLEEQAEIVAILDQFDTLTNSLTEGIPAEIELRQKQYEFYREKLLTF